jgi:hypothetical protein
VGIQPGCSPLLTALDFCGLARIAHKPKKKAHTLFWLISNPFHSEPLPERLYSLQISKAFWLLRFAG